MPKLIKNIIAVGKSSRAVIIPAVFCKMLDLNTGTKVYMELVGSQIVIKKAEGSKK